MDLIGRVSKVLNQALGDKPPTVGRETGTTGRDSNLSSPPELPAGSFSIKSRPAPDKNDYKGMLKTDGTIKGLLSVLTDPIAGADWYLDPPKSTSKAESEAQRQADIITDLLVKPSHQGGMADPYKMFLRRARKIPLTYGFCGFERVLHQKPRRLYRLL